MNFNLYPSKQAQEAIFSRKRQNLNQQVPFQKHLGMHLKFQIKFSGAS